MSSFFAYSTLTLSMVILLIFDRWVWRLGFPMKLKYSRVLRFFIWVHLVGFVLYVLGAFWIFLFNGAIAHFLGFKNLGTIPDEIFNGLLVGHMAFCFFYAFYLEWFSDRQKQQENMS